LSADEPIGVSSIDPPTVRKNDQNTEGKSRGNPVPHVDSIFNVTFLWKYSE
jgi:hypothetical protein